MASIITFLGYYLDTCDTPANLTLKARRLAGLDQKRLAKQIGVIHQKLRHWEHERLQPNDAQMRQLKEIAAAVAKVSQPAATEWPQSTD